MKWYEYIIIYLPFIVIMLLCLIPFLILISSSLTESDYIASHGVTLFPVGFTIDAYRTLFIYPDQLFKAYGLSLLITVLGTVLNIVLSILSAYPLSRQEFKARSAITFFYYISMIFNAGLIPTYIWYRNYLQIVDTFFVLFLPMVGIIGYLFLLRVFYASVPNELIESARIDGANELLILLKIATPLILPGLATITFYTVLMFWNEPNFALFYTDSLDLTPIALYMHRIIAQIEAIKWQQSISGDIRFEIPEQTLVFATAVATSAPMLFVFTLFQKYFVSGLTLGGVKG